MANPGPERRRHHIDVPHVPETPAGIPDAPAEEPASPVPAPAEPSRLPGEPVPA